MLFRKNEGIHPPSRDYISQYQKESAPNCSILSSHIFLICKRFIPALICCLAYAIVSFAIFWTCLYSILTLPHIFYCSSPGNGIWNSRRISFWDSNSISAINSVKSASSLCARSSRDT